MVVNGTANRYVHHGREEPETAIHIILPNSNIIITLQFWGGLREVAVGSVPRKVTIKCWQMYGGDSFGIRVVSMLQQFNRVRREPIQDLLIPDLLAAQVL